jgi:hypothetical protein
VRERPSILVTIILALVLLIVGGLGAGIVYAHIVGRTTAERPRA